MHMKKKKLEGSNLGEEDPVNVNEDYFVSCNHRQDWNCTQRTQP